MDRLARRVASRWAFEQACGPNPPVIPQWVGEWSDRVASRVAFYDNTVDVQVRTEEDLLQEAKDSVNIMLPKFLGALSQKFHERYHANASQTKTRINYFFTARHALETFALAIIIKQATVMLALTYIPNGVSTMQPDWSKAIEEQVRVDDPELAGLSLMRLTRKVLSRV